MALKELTSIKDQNSKLELEIKNLKDSMDIVIFENDSLNELKTTFISQLEVLQEELAVAGRRVRLRRVIDQRDLRRDNDSKPNVIGCKS